MNYLYSMPPNFLESETFPTTVRDKPKLTPYHNKP